MSMTRNASREKRSSVLCVTDQNRPFSLVLEIFTFIIDQMASASSKPISAKKRSTFLNNLSIFRPKSSSNNESSTNPLKTKSQIQLNNSPTNGTMCIGRLWMKKRTKRPVSLDLDLAKKIADETFVDPATQQSSPLKSPDFGTKCVNLSTDFSFSRRN